MTRLTLIAFASLCVLGGSAWALPEFALPPLVELEPGESVTVPVSAIALGTVGGMDLYVEVDTPLEVADISLDGTIWPPDDIFTVGLFPSLPDPQHGSAYVTTKTAIIVPAGGLLANVVISAPASAEVGIASELRLAWPEAGLESRLLPDESGDPSILPTAAIRIVPEPVTCLLLLVSTALLCRHR